MATGQVAAVPERHEGTEGASVLQTPYTAALGQKWAMIEAATFPGSAKIASVYKSGKCLDIASTSVGARVVQKHCISGAHSQQWIRDHSVNATFLRTQTRRTSDSTALVTLARGT